MAFLGVFLLPWLNAGWEVDKTISFSKERFLLVLALMLVFWFMGGGVALFIGGATEIKHAIAYGLGWQATMSGVGEGGSLLKKARTPRLPTPKTLAGK